MANSERLFRDADGAALERVARLEDENRQLRAEVDRLTAASAHEEGPPRPRSRPSQHLSGRFFLFAMALPFGILSLIMAAGVARHHRCPAARSPAYGVEVVGPRHRFHVEVPREVRSADDGCAPPYVYDGHGLRHYKRECIP